MAAVRKTDLQLEGKMAATSAPFPSCTSKSSSRPSPSSSVSVSLTLCGWLYVALGTNLLDSGKDGAREKTGIREGGGEEKAMMCAIIKCQLSILLPPLSVEKEQTVVGSVY